MLGFLDRKFSLIFIPLFLFLIFFSLGTTQVVAETCGSARTQVIKSCYESAPGHCVSDPATQTFVDYSCDNNAGSGFCSGFVLERYCGYVGGVCKLIDNGGWADIPCGAGGGDHSDDWGVGSVDGYSCTDRTISGWAVRGVGDSAINARVLINAIQFPYIAPAGDWVYSTDADGNLNGKPHLLTNTLRSDINDYYGLNADGLHGFSFSFPEEWIDGLSRDVIVAGTGSKKLFGQPLWNSPITITCAANSAPTGTLTCPSSPMYLGNSASFTLNGSDDDGNLSWAELWRSPASPVDPEGDWTAINNNIACTGGSCNPAAVSWTPTAIGTYKITANYFDSGTPAKQCSGNPFVTYPSYRNTGISFQLRMGMPDCV